MRHLNKGKKLGRVREERKALIRNLAKAFIKHEKLITTDVKAKVLRSFIERLITKAKNDNISNRRLAFSRLGSKEAVKKLFENIALRYKNRNGGYTRIYKLYNRKGDDALMSMIELVEEKLES